MNVDALQLCVHPGPGLVARFPGIVVGLWGEVGDDAAAVDELLAAARDGGISSLSAAVSAKAGQSLPAVAAIATGPGGVATLLAGAAELIANAPGGTQQLSGKGAAGPVEQVLADPVDVLYLFPTDQPPPDASPRRDLRQGVVLGGGTTLWLRPGGEAEAAAQPAAQATATAATPTPAAGTPAVPGEEEPAPFESVILFTGLEAVAQAAPLPTGQEAVQADVAASPGGSVTAVQGVHCANGHFNHPEAGACVYCGVEIPDQRTVVEGPRPTLGIFMVDDGSAFSLDGDYVVGRAPQLDPTVQSGEAYALALNDPDATASRVHANVHLNGWDVWMVDRGSANGTFVYPPGATAPIELVPNEWAQIEPGSTIQVGGRKIFYEAYH